jgi:hypothetical protein
MSALTTRTAWTVILGAMVITKVRGEKITDLLPDASDR